jgi:hypothetical protein
MTMPAMKRPLADFMALFLSSAGGKSYSPEIRDGQTHQATKPQSEKLSSERLGGREG